MPPKAVVQLDYAHSKCQSSSPQLMLITTNHQVRSVSPPRLPATTEVTLQTQTDIAEHKRPCHDSQTGGDKVRNKTRVCVGDVFERWRRLREEKNMKTVTQIVSLCRTGQHGILRVGGEYFECSCSTSNGHTDTQL